MDQLATIRSDYFADAKKTSRTKTDSMKAKPGTTAKRSGTRPSAGMAEDVRNMPSELRERATGIEPA